jgi:hypothetical protein
LIGCATGVAVREAIVAPARAQGQTGPNYEYRSVHVRAAEAQQTLDQFGREGWRLVNAAPVGQLLQYHALYFERQKAQERRRLSGSRPRRVASPRLGSLLA